VNVSLFLISVLSQRRCACPGKSSAALACAIYVTFHACSCSESHLKSIENYCSFFLEQVALRRNLNWESTCLDSISVPSD
jgi:hypothetical protein